MQAAEFWFVNVQHKARPIARASAAGRGTRDRRVWLAATQGKLPCSTCSGRRTKWSVTVDDLARADLERLESWNSATHLASVGKYLERRDRDGDVEYLVVRDENGDPVCKGAIDYSEHQGAGTIVQVGTRAGFEGRGLARMLMAEAERRIAARGLPVRLGVEPDNERAQRLYDHLGYVAVGEREVGWEHEYPDGTIGWYSTTIIEMEKRR